MKKLFVPLFLIFAASVANAQSNTTENVADTSITYWNLMMPQIEVLVERQGVLKNVPGSVGVVRQAELKKVAPLTGGEVFRRISGVHVVDEEGAGLRVNIGIRGLDTDRSRNVLVLEDGIPVALNPYGEPEMYYTPAIDRMSGVEVIKGSGQILFGPQTIGGVVNYVTSNPPTTPEGRIKIVGGGSGFFSGLASYGATYGNVGFQTTFLRKQAEQLGYAGFAINDFSTKFRFKLSDNSTLGVKLGIYDEKSNSTYIGLTQTMYDRGGEDFALMSPDDNLDIRRYSLSATHKYRISEKLNLQTTAYGYTTTRNWQRQDFSSNPTVSNQTGVVWGDTSVSGGAIFMRDQNGQRNRQFEVAGIEPRLTYEYAVAGKKSELQTGVRFLFERAFEQRVNGTKADAVSGNLVEDEMRTGQAFSAFIQNETALSKKLSLTLGLRSENYNYEREIFRNTFNSNGRNQVVDTNVVANNSINTLIPGIGLNLNLTPKMTVFGGAHKGYAPPRIKDAISTQGEAYQLESENSWNFELGTRGNLTDYLSVELTGFYMDFSNQIIPVSESSGGTGVGLVNGGATLHRGVEFSYLWDISKMIKTTNLVLTWQTNFTYSIANFSEDRFQDDINLNGNRTPYSPEYFVTSSLNFEYAEQYGVQLTGTFVGEQFGDELNTIAPTADGRIGKIAAYNIFDANFYVKIPKINSTVNLSVKNITDERYIATRRPQGIRVGLPRFISAGIDFNF